MKLPRFSKRAAADADRSHKAIVEIRLLGPLPLPSSFHTREPSGSLFIGGRFAGSSVRLLRKSRSYESSLEKAGVWSRVLLMALSQTLRTDEGEPGEGT